MGSGDNKVFCYFEMRDDIDDSASDVVGLVVATLESFEGMDWNG